jgi:beta-galactosidase
MLSRLLARLGLLSIFVATIHQSTIAHAQSSARERLSIDADWRFIKNDPPDTGDKLAYNNIKQWMMSTGENLTVDADAPKHPRPAGNLGEDVAYTKTDFDDSQWRLLNLPHDFGIEGPFDPNAAGSTGKLPFQGIAWYRKHLEIPASDQGKQFFLDIDGAMAYPNVWINGQYAGGWGYGFSSFRVDLTPFAKPGGTNVIAIRVENPDRSARWYPGGGIYRNVWLVKTSPVHVARYGTQLTTPEAGKDSASVDLKVTIDNDSKADSSAMVRTQIFEIDSQDRKTGNAVASSETKTIQIGAGKNAIAGLNLKIASPKFWGLSSPNRYVAVTSVEQDGKTIDSYDTPFGIRTLKFDPDNGFFLNGEHISLNGVCDHADLGALGTVVNYRGLQRQVEILKEMGCNAIRTSHNPPAPELLDICDKMGVMVLDESFDCWVRGKTTNDYHLLFPDWSEKDLRNLLRRDRNHPSVVIWSIGNEIPDQGPAGHPIATRLARFVHEEDPTRPATAAINNDSTAYNGFQNIVDIFGFNYLRGVGLENQMSMYIRFHAATPNKFVFSTESASTISTRGEYAFPFSEDKGGGAVPNEPQMSSYDLYAPAWANPPDWDFQTQDQSSFVGGQFVWTGFDYLGEPTRNHVTVGTPRGARNGANASGGATTRGGVLQGRGRGAFQSDDPSRSSYFGIIDIAGFKKDRFYLYQAYWRPQMPMAHILPHWNWPDRVGQVTPVHVYTSGDEAELFLNGKSLGRKKKGQYEYRLRWDDVVYEPGELKVVAYKNGAHWAEEVVKTTGPAAKISIAPDRKTILADGNDLSFVTVSVNDAQGLMVPRSRNLLHFELSGPGEIVAVDNGDPTSMESFQSKNMKAFNGLCLVIIRAKAGQAGAITLWAKSDGLTDGEAIIEGAAAR